MRKYKFCKNNYVEKTPLSPVEKLCERGFNDSQSLLGRRRSLAEINQSRFRDIPDWMHFLSILLSLFLRGIIKILASDSKFRAKESENVVCGCANSRFAKNASESKEGKVEEESETDELKSGFAPNPSSFFSLSLRLHSTPIAGKALSNHKPQWKAENAIFLLLTKARKPLSFFSGD